MIILNNEIEKAIQSRPAPFAVSYHGDSTIIVDADGRWVTGQIARDIAEQLALSMTNAKVQRKCV